MVTVQDAVAIAVAFAAAVWLARTLWRQLLGTAPCGPPSSAPPGADGFVPLESLTRSDKPGANHG